MKRRREKEKLFRCDHTLKQKKQCIWDYFSRIFVVLSSSTNFFLEVSLSFVSECRQQNRVGYLSEKRKKIKKKHFNFPTFDIKRSTFTCSTTSIMATNTKSTTASSSTRLPSESNARMVQNFHLVWLDGSIDETNDDCRNSITKLRQVVNAVSTFVDVDECIDFINGIQEERAFVIFSGALGKIAVPMVHDKPQVNTIYIFCGNKGHHEKMGQRMA